MTRSVIVSKLKSFKFDPAEYWVVGGAAMVLYGIKEQTDDVDLGCTTKLADELEKAGRLYKITPDGNRWFRLDDGTEVFENWIYDTVVVVEKSIPVISLQGLLTMKRLLGREKDLKDVALIKEHLNE